MKQLFYSLLIIISFASCKKDDIEEPKEVFLLTEYEDREGIMKFEYNDRNQLIGGESYSKSIGGSTPYNTFFRLIYENNKPVEFQYRKEGTPEFTTQATFFYDNKGNLIKSFFPPPFNDTVYRFTYNDQGKMTSFAQKNYVGIYQRQWTYDENGNLKVEDRQSYSYAPDKVTIISDNTYRIRHQYDDKKNPFTHNGLGQLLAGMGMISETTMEFLVSQNNPLG